MGFSINATSSSVAIVGDVALTETKRTVSAVSWGTAGGAGGLQTMGTVPAGKVWRIVSIATSVRTKNSTADVYAETQLNGVAFMSVVDTNLATYGNGGQFGSMTFNYYTAPVLTAGQLVRVAWGAGTHVFTAVHYVQEDAI